MAFVYVLTNLAGIARSELPGAFGKRVGLTLSSIATAGVTVRGDHPDADFLLECDSLLKVYETDVPGRTTPLLHFHGRQVAAEEAADAGGTGPTVAATFADPGWLLTRRLIGKTAGGYSRGTALAPIARGTIITELLAATNAEGNTGTRIGTVGATAATSVAGWFYKPLLEAIAELCATLDGPDWRIRPIEYDAGSFGELDVTDPIGQNRPDAIFEYGDGLFNVRSYKRPVTLEGAANRLYSIPPGGPDNATQAVLTEENAASQAIRGILEATLATDLQVEELRRRLAQHHVAIRQGPRQVISFDPVRGLDGRVPRVGVDFNVGDTITFRASVERDGTIARRINALFRVYGVELAVDTEGAATPTLTVTPSA